MAQRVSFARSSIAASRSASQIPARLRCTLSPRSTRSMVCARCWVSSRAPSPAWRMDTDASPRNPHARCYILARVSATAAPIVNIVGDHATYHAQYDAPLASDIAGLARPVSGWVHSSPSALTVAADGARAVAASLKPPGQVATLILPADTAWNDADGPSPALPREAPASASRGAIDRIAAVLNSGKKCALLMRGAVLKERGLTAAGRIAAKSGARLMCDTFAPRLQRGAGRVRVERIPYFAEQMVEFLSTGSAHPYRHQAAG